MEQLYLDKKYQLILVKTSQALEKNPTNRAAIYYSALAKAQLGFPYVGLIKIVSLIDPNNNMKQSHQLEQDRLMISEMIGEKCTPDKTEIIDHTEMPRNFSWVWNGYLIGSSDIKTKQQLMVLKSIGVDKVINLIDETNRYELGLLYQDTDVNLYHQKVENRKPPTIEQMDNIMNCCEHEFRNNRQVVVHCGGGKGRAGTVIACLMLKHGLIEPNNYFLNNPPLSPSDVIEHLRKIRPHSIETDEQEIFVKQYHNHLWRQYQTQLNSPKLSTLTRYPSTPYIYTSPSKNDPDNNEIFDQHKLHHLMSQKTQIIITEKLDGGNCCLYEGRVYARTHSQPTGHSSFNTIKDLYYHRVLPMIEDHPELENLAFYGENLTAIHSIEYTKLNDWFYLFGVFCPKRQLWYSWKDVEYVANILDLPTPPILFSGELTSVEKLHDLLKKEILTPSALSINNKEGFVIRSGDSFFTEDFGSMVCKYVRENHIQTQSDWGTSWKKSRLLTKMNDVIDIEDVPPALPPPKPIKLKTKSKIPSMILLTGPPASGKSSFAKQMKKYYPEINIINQDSLKSRDACENLVGEYARKRTPFILDRCNPTSEERKYWLKLAFDPTDAICIHFELPVELLIHRAKNRHDHPTIPIGTGETAIKQFLKQMESPRDSEKFNKVYQIRSIEDMNKLLQRFNAEPYNDDSFFKFPRTCHLFDAREVDQTAPCSVQRDDLLLNHKERELFFNKLVTIEEKIDGANIGISVNSELKFQFQNRSHYVNSTSHPQFKTLDNWLAEHFQELWDVLGTGQYILFGEWCYGVHSLNYKKLADHFVAFDLYDKWNSKFLSRKYFREILLKTSITLVPILDVIELKDEKQVYKYFSKLSEFDDELLIEGVYIRLDDPDGKFLLDRCKAVSPQFTAGLTKSWTKKDLQVNQVLR